MHFRGNYSKLAYGGIIALIIYIVVTVVLYGLARYPTDRQLEFTYSGMSQCLYNDKMHGQPFRQKNALLEIYLSAKRFSAPKDSIVRCGTMESLAKYGFVTKKMPDVTVESSDDGPVFMIYAKTSTPGAVCSMGDETKELNLHRFYIKGDGFTTTTECHSRDTLPDISPSGS